MNATQKNSTQDPKSPGTLKFEGFQAGQIIKAYDHRPRIWVEDGEVLEQNLYVVGRIKEVTDSYPGVFGSVKGYVIDVMKDTVFTQDPREEVFVPMEVHGIDWDGRVTRVEEIQPNRV